eukprot:5908427-Amphidinium_carterae.6
MISNVIWFCEVWPGKSRTRRYSLRYRVRPSRHHQYIVWCDAAIAVLNKACLPLTDQEDNPSLAESCNLPASRVVATVPGAPHQRPCMPGMAHA